MVEETNNKGYEGAGLRGPIWTLAGTAIGGLAMSLLGAHSGIGGFGSVGNTATQAANTAVALELAKKDSEIALLKANADTDKKLVDVYSELRKQDKAQDAIIANINTRLTAVETSAPLREQIVLGQVQSVANAATSGIANLQTQIACIQNTLSGVLKTVVPNSSVCPGWGNVTITPAAT